MQESIGWKQLNKRYILVSPASKKFYLSVLISIKEIIDIRD